jgi:DUF3037 family protein
MDKLACRYATVRFLPYPETGEFANVGIVLACPAVGYFGFRLQRRRYGRITQFFEHLDAKIYTQAICHFEQELARVKAAEGADRNADLLRAAFDALTHPREAILRFGERRAILARDPAQATDQLFARYVEHDFAQREHFELEMERRVQRLLREIPLRAPFRPDEIGNDEIHARFPLVQTIDGRPAKVIKPLNLTQDEPNRIYDHGDRWISKTARLRRAALLPSDVLFMLKAPPKLAEKRYRAFADIRQQLGGLGVVVADEAEQIRILEFAQAA